MSVCFAKLTILIFFALLFFVRPAFSQDSCNLSNQPRLQNFALGMSPAEAQGAIGKAAKIKVKKKGQRTFFQNYIKKPADGSLAGVRAFYLRFFDARLYQIEIFYEDRAAWQTLPDFVAALSAETAVPPTAWREEKTKFVANCGAFTIYADKILNPHVELTDENIRARVEVLRAKEKKTFPSLPF